MRLHRGLICVLLAGLGLPRVSGFHVQLPTSQSGKTVRLQNLCSVPATASDVEEKGTATLTLGGKANISSNPVPKTTDEKLEAFIGDPENRNLLCTAGGKRPSSYIDLTPELMDLWKRKCDEVGGAEYPDENDTLLRVQTGGIRFPGLQLESIATIGVKTVKGQENTFYEFVLLKDEQNVNGLPPIVWIFRKLTGADETDSEDRQSAVSLTKISYKEVSDSEIAFVSDGSLTIQINFPAFLLKILPTNKEKAEESGSKSIAKVLEKDIKKSMDAFEKAYLEMSS